MEIVPFGGWERNARLVSEAIEAIVTLEVGPRVLAFGFRGGRNEFAVHAKDAGKRGEATYHSYGGHRLWIAPEDEVRTLQPDNDPVAVTQEGETTVFSGSPDRFHLRKAMALRPIAGGFAVEHRIHNEGAYPARLAPWALSQMAPGGRCIFPLGPAISHADRVLPTQPLALWGYTDLTDRRWTLGARAIALQQTNEPRPQKLGAWVSAGWAAYVRPEGDQDVVFLTRFSAEPGDHPDFGVNFETFTRHDMLEIETLGPLQDVPPGGAALWREAWTLHRLPPLPPGPDACVAELQSLVDSLPKVDLL
jgi:hypothetical protein